MWFLYLYLPTLRVTSILQSRSSPILDPILAPELIRTSIPTSRPTPRPTPKLVLRITPRHPPVPSSRTTSRPAPRTLFKSEKGYYQLVKIYGAFSNRDIKYESNGDGNKPLSIEE